MMIKKYDAIVIGSGQAGTPLSKKLAETGRRTALIEQRWVGGTCVNDGCSPTKAMIASARLAYLIGKDDELGVNTGKLKIDIAKILERKDEIVNRMRKNSEDGILQTKNLDLIYGTASFSGDKEIAVALNGGGETMFAAEEIYINTGAKPAIPEITGLDHIDYLTSTSIMELKQIPEHLLIIGTGYVGMEFGQMYRRFGSKVTMLETSKRIMPKEDEDIARAVEKIFVDEGISILKDCQLKEFRKTGKKIKAYAVIDGQKKIITCTHVLVATGRRPQGEMLNPSKAGVELDKRGFIKVDRFLETTAKGIFALGDVNGGPPFTHIAFDDYRIIIHNISNKAKRDTDNRLLPYCMFTDPQLGRVGITEQEAKKKGLDILVASMPNTAVARAIEMGDTRGLMKAVVDKKTGQILGASILGTEGGEVVTVLQMAMLGGITWQEVHDGVFAHPTFSESLNNLFAFPDK
ncbi:mercuric reductase [Dyadobacter sp. 32]|uniref:mercuric reductase n=1 Tax=Dyadobacter sp. 32 TaxID=538966 RepID=UPI0039C5DE39